MVHTISEPIARFADTEGDLEAELGIGVVAQTT